MKKIKDVKPTGSQVLVELLSAQEAIGTNLIIEGDSAHTGAPQAYVLDAGPTCSPENWGFKVGDRVLLQGKHVPLPNLPEWTRMRSLVEPTMIKAVLVEETEEKIACCGGGKCKSKAS